MEMQLSLFERNSTAPIQVIPQEHKHSENIIVVRPPWAKKTPPKKPNYRKGEEQTVFPIKKMEELEAMASWLYKNTDRKYLLGFVLGINLGLRANELLNLRVSDVFNRDGSIKYIEDEENTSDRISIFQSKTDKVRGVYLNEACISILNWYYPQGCTKNHNDFIFSSREGGSVKPDTFRKILKSAAKACGLKQNIGTHTLRKTWGWWQYTTNTGKVYGDVSQLQRLFGHDSSMTTLRYLGIMDQEDKALYHSLNLDVAGKLIAE